VALTPGTRLTPRESQVRREGWPIQHQWQPRPLQQLHAGWHRRQRSYFNNSALNQAGIGGAPAALLPVEAIEEFNLQSQFSTEYGRNSGSVVNIVTRSGTNRLHGSAFDFSGTAASTHATFQLRTAEIGIPKQQLRRRSRRTHRQRQDFFFGAYEGERERVGSDFLLLVPTQSEFRRRDPSHKLSTVA